MQTTGEWAPDGMWPSPCTVRPALSCWHPNSLQSPGMEESIGDWWVGEKRLKNYMLKNRLISIIIVILLDGLAFLLFIKFGFAGTVSAGNTSDERRRRRGGRERGDGKTVAAKGHPP